MEPVAILSLIWANKEEIIGSAGAVVLVASTIAQHTPTVKDDKFWSRVWSLIDIMPGSIGKAAPDQTVEEQHAKPKVTKDVVRLVKHVATGKFK